MVQRKVVSVIDEAGIESTLRNELKREGAVKLNRVKPIGVRAAIVEILVRDGFEVTKTVIRRPLQVQLREALEHGALVPVKSIASYVRGATASERKREIEIAVREGAARVVLRGTAEVLAGPEVRVLSATEIQMLRTRVAELGRALEKVTRKRGVTLLAADASAVLSEALVAMGGSAQAKVGARAPSPTPESNAPHDYAMQALLDAVDSARDVRTGLSFVPAVVGRLAPALSTSAAVKLLLTAAERELLELRPEGGIGRLSEAELSVCPPGPHDTRLSWARRLTGGAT